MNSKRVLMLILIGLAISAVIFGIVLINGIISGGTVAFLIVSVSRQILPPVDLATYFLLAFIPTVAHFSIMVWYRKRKEHAIPSKTPLPVTTPPQKPYRNLKIAIIAVLVYILHLYASVEYGLTQNLVVFHHQLKFTSSRYNFNLSLYKS